VIFRRSPDVVARFEDHFTEQASGNVVYRPPGAATGLVLSRADYASLRERFEQRLRVAVALNWLIAAGVGGWGLRSYLRSGSIIEALIAIALGSGAIFLLSLRTHLEILRPLERDRSELEKGGAVSRTRH
jgi:hypothetical protein